MNGKYKYIPTYVLLKEDFYECRQKNAWCLLAWAAIARHII